MLVDPLAGQLLGTSRDGLVVAEWTAEVGTHEIAPFHLHEDDDEAWYVLAGTLGFLLGHERLEAGPGAAVLARKGVPHTYWNAGPVEARYLLVMTGNIAGLIAAIHGGDADVPALFARHRSALVSPDDYLAAPS